MEKRHHEYRSDKLVSGDYLLPYAVWRRKKNKSKYYEILRETDVSFPMEDSCFRSMA